MIQNHNSFPQPGLSSALPQQVSEIFDPNKWRTVTDFNFTDITYHRGVRRKDISSQSNHVSATSGTDECHFKSQNSDQQSTDTVPQHSHQHPELKVNNPPQELVTEDLPWVRIAFNRPLVRNAFRPHTVDELYQALDHARLDPTIGAIILTGNGPSVKDGGWAFCSGGDQRVRGKDGYRYEYDNSDPNAKTADRQAQIDNARNGRLHIIEVQRLIRTMPKVVIAAVPGWATGGGHSLEVVCDLVIASREHAKFMQVDATVGSFDAGYGSGLLARQVGDRKAREIFFLARPYTADEAVSWGAINASVPHETLEDTAIEYAAQVCRQSPQAIRMLKIAFNLVDDGLAGQQVFAGEATRLAYMTEEAAEGRDAFLERRSPNWSSFPYYS